MAECTCIYDVCVVPSVLFCLAEGNAYDVRVVPSVVWQNVLAYMMYVLSQRVLFCLAEGNAYDVRVVPSVVWQKVYAYMTYVLSPVFCSVWQKVYAYMTMSCPQCFVLCGRRHNMTVNIIPSVLYVCVFMF